MSGRYRSFLVVTGLLVFLITLAACGSIPKHITESDLPHDQWPIELYQPAEDLSFVKSRLNEANPGLFIAAIDRIRNSNAEDAYAPVLEFAENNGLSDLFQTRIHQSGVLGQLSREGEIIASDRFNYGDVEDGFIRVTPLIQLTHNFAALLVTLEFKEYTPGLTGLSMNGITQKYHYVHRLDGFDEKKSRVEYAEAWEELGEDRFVSIVESGIGEVIEMMKSYLANPNPNLLSKKEYYVEGYGMLSWRSHIWGGGEDVVWLISRNVQNLVFAAPRDFVQEAEWEEASRP